MSLSVRDTHAAPVIQADDFILSSLRSVLAVVPIRVHPASGFSIRFEGPSPMRM